MNKLQTIKREKVINYEIEKNPVKILGMNFRLLISYKNIKISELNVIGKNIQVYLPNKFKRIGNMQILNLALYKMYEAIAKEEIENSMEKTRLMLRYAPEDFEIKKLNGKLAQCVDNKILIDPEIVKYERGIIDFIVLHQFCHLKYKTHSKKFYEIMKKHMPNYNFYEKQLENLKY